MKLRPLHARASLLTAMVVPLALAAQQDTLHLPFRHLGIEHGLSQGMVNSITQDRHGFMWFATKDGLDRYDGYFFRVFRHVPGDPSSLAESYVNVVREAPDGRLWVGLATQGVQVLDLRTETFSTVSLGPQAGDGYVMDIVFDPRGTVWVATGTGLFKLVSDGRDGHRVTRVFDRQCRIAMDRRGRIWGYLMDVGTFRIVPGEVQDRVDTLDMGGWTEGLWNSNPQSTLNGMIAVDPGSGRVFGVHPYFIAEYDTLTMTPRLLYRLPGNTEWRLEPEDVVLDPRGGLWIGSHKLWRYDLRTGRMSRVLAADPNLSGMMDFIGSSYMDRSGLLWLATLGHGILHYDPLIERFHTQRTGSVQWMSVTPAGDIIVQHLDDVLRVFDPDEERFTWALRKDAPEVRQVFGEPQAAVDAVLADSDGGFWLAKGDLVHFDPRSRRFTLHPVRYTPPGVPGRFRGVFPIVLDGDSAIWSGNNDVFQRFDRSTGATQDFAYPFPATFTTYYFVQAIHRDAEGVFWLATIKGLLRFDPVAKAWSTYPHDPSRASSLAHDIVFCITPDPAMPERYLWLGTNSGMDRFDKQNGSCIHYTENEGLPNDVVYGIVPDDEGALWLSTNKGIACFVPGQDPVRTFSERDGLQGDEFNRYAFGKLPDGRLFFGGTNGFSVFDPREVLAPPVQAPVRITGIRLVNEPLRVGDPEAPLQLPPFMAGGMAIPHHVNMVTFEFATMEFSTPAAHRYRYQLVGFDPDPIEAGQNSNAIYTNLDPGSYIFRVWGRDRAGTWTAGPAEFALEVLPPWWRTTWAYALAFLVVSGTAVLYVRGLNMRNLRLEEMVKKRTAELEAAKDRAEHSEAAKQQFLANMSHEIRTPMNAIMGMSETLRRREKLPEQGKYLDAIAQSSENLMVVLNDILDLSKVEAGHVHLEPVPMDPAAVLRNAMGIMQHRADEKGLALGCDVAPEVPERVLGDPARLNQMLLNLLGNAVKFTHNGGVSVVLRVAESTEERTVLRFDVRDTGIGIPADRQESIFEEFTQAKSDHTRRYGGTGLGLTITKRLAGLHGGSIALDSREGEGSVFTLLLPYERPHEVPGTPAGRKPRAELQDLTILLVEDKRFNVIVARDRLESVVPGLTLHVAANGRLAVEMVQGTSYDLVLMDIQMPEMDGYAATRAIRALPGERGRIPILAMTANVLPDELERCTEAGMNGHIPKPFTREQLLDALTALRLR